MKDEDKTKQELIEELEGLRLRVAEMEDTQIRLKSTERALRESEEMFKSFIDYSPAIAFLKDDQNRILYVNRQWEHQFNRTLSDVQGMSTEEIWPGKTGIEYREHDRKVLNSGKALEFVEKSLGADNDVRYWWMIRFPMEDSKGQRYTGGVALDITEQKKVEEALHESEQMLRTILSTSPVGIGLTKERRIEWVNEAWKRIFGLEDEHEYLGKDARILYPSEEEYERAGKVLYRDLETGKVSETDTKFRRRDGSVFDGNIKLKALDPLDPAKGMISAVSDISSRKRAEIQLQKLALIVQNSGEFIALSDLDRRLIFINGAGAKMVGISEENVGEYAILDLVPESYREIVKTEVIPEIFEKGRWEGFLQLRHIETGKLIDTQAMTFLIRDPGTNQPLYLANVSLDITEQRQAEEALRESERKFRLVTETIEDVFWMSTPGVQEMVYISPAYEKVWGRTTDSLYKSPQSFLEVVHPDDRELLRKTFLEHHSKGGQYTCEYRIMPTDDSVRWIHERGFPIFDERGKLQFMCGLCTDITDRKSAEQALQVNEERLTYILEGSREGFWDWNIETGEVHRNERWAEMLGYSSKDIESAVSQWDRLVHPEDKDKAWQSITDHLEGRREEYESEYRMLTKDGEWRWVFDHGRVVKRDPEGKPIRMAGTLTDITDRKRWEETLRESEEKYRATFNNASVGIDLVDGEGRFLEVNRTLAEFLGYTPEELRHRTVFDLTYPEDVARSRELHAAMAEGQTEAYSVEKRYVRKDGSILWADVSVAALRDAEGQYWATVGVIVDITRRKKLEETRVRLGAAVEQAAETVVIADPQGTIVYVNPCFERTTGYSREEAVGNNPRILKSGRHDEEFYKGLWDTISDGRVWTGRLINRKKDGTLFEEDASISPVKDESGKIVNYVAVKRDVTREVSLHKQLLQAQKMEAIGTLAGGIAHDFNNILQVTLGFSELLLEGKSKKDQEYEDLQKIYHAAHSGSTLVRNLFTFSRKVEPRAVPLDLNNQIRLVEKLLRRTIPRMIEMRMKLAEGLKRVYADPGQIEQIVMNLALNARDAMGEKGTLTIQTENVVLDEEYCRLHIEAKPGEHVLLTVSDTGSGMDRETLQHIFEPFYTTKELGRGTGLGLAMVHGIVKQHDGHLACYSEVGKGTTFKIYFPAITSVPEDVAESTAEMPAFGTETLLLVDDEDDVRALGERILTKNGYSVLVAGNGEEALTVYARETERISLIILDLIMPSMGGRDCLEELLRIDPAVKVLIASGLAADETTKECAGLGAKGCVNKPFRLKELLRQVRKTLDES